MSTDESHGRGMQRVFVSDEDRTAVFKRVSDIFGGKWHIAILYHLSRSEGVRFSDLKTEIDGISSKMLSESLDRLETRHGVVRREIVNDKPLHVEYSLSERGESIEPVLWTIVDWAGTNRAGIAGGSEDGFKR